MNDIIEFINSFTKPRIIFFTISNSLSVFAWPEIGTFATLALMVVCWAVFIAFALIDGIQKQVDRLEMHYSEFREGLDER